MNNCTVAKTKHNLHVARYEILNPDSFLYFLFSQKPLEVREGNVKPTDYKVCVLGLWAAQEAQGRRLVELADALESGR